MAAALAAGWLAGWWWSVPLWLAVAFVLQFFRDPPREIPGSGRTVVSPADGRIVAVESAEDPYLKRPAIKVSVFMNVFNVHSNRSPVDGEVKQFWYNRGRVRERGARQGFGRERAQRAVAADADAGADVTCVQVAGLIARRILCYAKAGDRLRRGQRFGFIRFGSRVDVYLPRRGARQGGARRQGPGGEHRPGASS